MLLDIGVEHDAVSVVLIGADVLTGQSSIGRPNDWIDAAGDRATGRAAKPAAGQVPVRVVGAAAGVALEATVVLSSLLGALVAAALLGFAAHFANVLPVLRADAATGVRGLPQRLGPRSEPR